MEDKFTMGTGQAHELAMAFGRNGWTNADVKRLSEGDMLARMLPIVRGQVEVKQPELPTEITVGDVTYEIFSFLWEDEKSVVGHTMVERAEEMNANLGQEDRDRFKKNRSDIPPVLRGKIVFVFPNCRHPDDYNLVAFLYWDGVDWVQSWHQLDGDWCHDWRGRFRVLRRKAAA